MAARIIDGKAVAAAVRERVRVDVAAYVEEAGRAPTLATVIVGDDPASEIYVAQQAQGLRGGRDELGPPRARRRRPARRSCWSWSRALGADDEVDGILVQLPVPAQIDPDAVVAAIDPRKDVDGLTPLNAGLLAHGTPGPGALHAGRGDGAAAPTRGSSWRAPRRSWSAARSWSACRSRGCCSAPTRPSPICHSRTRDLDATCARADVLVAAVGVPRAARRRRGQARRGGDRRRHEPHRGRPLRRRRLRGGGARSRRRSRRCPAASGR